MSSKNYGAAVSGYLDATDRNWETTVFQAGKPVLDKELNLSEDISGGLTQDALRRLMPSGWLSDDFLDNSDNNLTLSIAIRCKPTKAHVNGWLLTVKDPSVPSIGEATDLPTPAGPTTAGSRRTDLIILEVWRRLISAAPSTEGKSSSGRIWRYGNVKSCFDDPSTSTFVDDLKDVNVGSETTKRVQVQYRLRYVQDVDLASYPNGLGDPSVVPNSVPVTAGAPDGVAVPTYLYTNQSVNGDAGLWRAGDGSLAAQTALGTVDGYMYAIPYYAVTRYNSAAYHPTTNHNGCPNFVVSGRSTYVDPHQLIDLRFGVNPNGWNYREVMEKNLGLVLDNKLQTETATTAFGGGFFGSTLNVVDEIGPDVMTTGGTHIGYFDSIHTCYSDRPTVEITTLRYTRPGGGNWQAGDQILIDPAALPVYPGVTTVDWLSSNPPPRRGRFTEVVSIRFMGETASKKTTTLGLQQVPRIENLGVYQVGPPYPTFTLQSIPAGITDEPLYLELYVEYPAGVGLSMTPNYSDTTAIEFSYPITITQGTLPGATVVRSTTKSKRQVTVMARYTNATYTYVANGSLVHYMPEKIESSNSISVTVNGNPVWASIASNSNDRRITISPNPVSGDIVVVTYEAERPVPFNTVQVALPYLAAAPQTVKEAFLPTPELKVIPRHIDDALRILTVGSGSIEDSYPYPYAYTQVGGISSGVPSFAGDHQLHGNSTIFVSEFSSTTGFLKLSNFIDFTPASNEVVFRRLANDVDAEGRSFYSRYIPDFYKPNAYAQPLTGPKRHRNFLPMLVELPEDSILGFKGQLFLMLLVREAVFDQSNFVSMDSSATTTSASIFRIKGKLLNKRS